MMPRTDEAEALARRERVRRALHDELWGAIAPGLRITASFGVVTAPDAVDLDGLSRDADASHVRGQARRARSRRRRVGCAP